MAPLPEHPSSSSAISNHVRATTPDSSLPSSPPRKLKPKKRATVTPRTFKRFFTPRRSIGKSGKDRVARDALYDITSSGANAGSSPPQDASMLPDWNEDSPNRKRKVWELSSPEDTPERSSPLKRLARGFKEKRSYIINKEPAGISDEELANTTDEEELASVTDDDISDIRRNIAQLPRPVVRSKFRGSVGDYLRRELAQPAQPTKRLRIDYYSDWQTETESFYSRPDDVHVCDNITSTPSDSSLPFCVAACNTNSLVAIGDEDGGVRLLETQLDGEPSFNKFYLAFRPHGNAVMDLAFSDDDLLLATASGDQTSQIIDMPTQQTTYTLSKHIATVKQVRFQPGTNNKVIATSSRDGAIQIWDLRCKGTERPAYDIKLNINGPEPHAATTYAPESRMTYATMVNRIPQAHNPRDVAPGVSAARGLGPSATDVSVTALSFLSPTNPHILLSGSGVEATVKVWDLRSNYSQRRAQPSPLCQARPPHSNGRGLTSMALSGDGARLYTLCRDRTIYTYSTSSLLLGTGAERRTKAQPKSGTPHDTATGPLYGFKHPQLSVDTFYVKLAVRPARGDRTEMLAVGSSDCCAVLFPTDERHLRHSSSYNTGSAAPALQPLPSPVTPTTPPPRPSLPGGGVRGAGSWQASARAADAAPPLYRHGTPLVRGHETEVTCVAWTSGGELVTLSDDMRCRVWREGGHTARELRVGGESGGRRWGHGWAELDGGVASAGWDDGE